MKYVKRLSRIISCALIVALLIAMLPVAIADAGVYTLSVMCNDNTYELDVLENNGTWFADINDLAGVAGCEASVNSERGIVSLYKNEPFVILYSVNENECVCEGGDYYAPLQDAAENVGIYFYETDPLRAVIFRTPEQMLTEIEDIFYDERYQITQLLLTDGYAIAGSFAQIYAIMPFVGSGSLVGLISGEDEAERYRNAMSAILANDGSTTEFIDSVGEVSGEVHENAKILRAIGELTSKGGELYEYLLSKGISEELLDVLAYEDDPYDYLDTWFEDWSSVLAAINFEYFLDLCAFYAVSLDTEESILVALKRVFENSENENARSAVEHLLNNRFGSGGVALADIYGGMLWSVSSDYINNRIDDIAYGGYAAGAKLIARGIDTVFGASDKTEAYLYFPIFASIQQELYDYFRVHMDEVDEHTMYDIRAVAIMYLKAAIAAYEFAAFDESLKESLATAFEVLNAELANVLSYSEDEYDPEYTNAEFICWLDQTISEYLAVPSNTPAVQDSPSSPAMSNLFNGTYWNWSKGPTNGTNYMAKFYNDGTFEYIALSFMLAGDVEKLNWGEYSYSDGVLIVGDSEEYDLMDDGTFNSREKYYSALYNDEYIHYTFTPTDSSMWEQMYDLNYDAPTPTPTSVMNLAPESSLWDGTYTVRLYEDSFYEVDGHICAEAEWMLDMTFTEEYVYSLKPGDIVDLSEYGKEDIIIESIITPHDSDTLGDSMIRFDDDKEPFGYYFWYDDEIDLWILGQDAGNGWFPYVASTEILAFSDSVEIRESTWDGLYYLDKPYDLDFYEDGDIAYVTIEDGLVTTLEYERIW